MSNCIACSSSFSLNATTSKLCPDCLQQALQEKGHCQACNAPLDLSSPYCRQCDHRHGMSNCSLCDYELFKHAAITVTGQYYLPEDPEEQLLVRLWKKISRPRETRTHYYHHYCAQARPEVMEGDKVTVQTLPRNPQRSGESSQLSPPPSSPNATRVESLSSSSPQSNSDSSEHSESLSSDIFGCQAPTDLDPAPATHDNAPQTRINPTFIQEYQAGKRNLSGLKELDSVCEDLNLAGIDLQTATLIGANWARVNLSQANLSFAKLDQANFREIDFKGALLRDVMIRNAQIFLSDFGAADLSEANFQGSDFYASYFQRAYLTRANLVQAKLDAADFSWAYLADANLTEASLIETILEGAILDNACLISSNFTWANLQDTSFIKANLNRANFQFSNLAGADFSGAQLIDADLSQTNLGATRSLCQAQYNERTQFPPNFNPSENEMCKVQSA